MVSICHVVRSGDDEEKPPSIHRHVHESQAPDFRLRAIGSSNVENGSYNVHIAFVVM